MPAVVGEVQPVRPVRPTGPILAGFWRGASLRKVGRGTEYFSLYLNLVGQVGQVGPALKNRGLLASNLVAGAWTGRTAASSGVGQGSKVSPPYPHSHHPACRGALPGGPGLTVHAPCRGDVMPSPLRRLPRYDRSRATPPCPAAPGRRRLQRHHLPPPCRTRFRLTTASRPSSCSRATAWMGLRHRRVCLPPFTNFLPTRCEPKHVADRRAQGPGDPHAGQG